MKSSELAVEFINTASLDERSQEEVERLVTLLKTRESAVAHPGFLKPGDVASKVEARLGYKFTVSDHTRCWKHFKVRPPVEASDPTICKIEYCHYDVPHKDHIYTEAWVEFLVSTLSDPDTYRSILGRELEAVVETKAVGAEASG